MIALNSDSNSDSHSDIDESDIDVDIDIDNDNGFNRDCGTNSFDDTKMVNKMIIFFKSLI